MDPRAAGRDGEELMRGMKDRVIGQDAVIQSIVEIVQRFRADMCDPQRPGGSLLLLGPTGSGKTRSAEATAECLLNNSRAVIRIDCAEFQHSHEIAKLIGSPPGYLGHRETHPLLSQEVLNQYHTDTLKLSIVLFDEIEKASDALWNLLLGILDKATLTLGDNRRVDFSRSLVFCTSNAGGRDITSYLRPPIGFSVSRPANDAKLGEKIAKLGSNAAGRIFAPEFLNRFDAIVSFAPLSEGDIAKILDLEVAHVQDRVSPTVQFSLTSGAKSFLLKEGTADPRWGARAIRRSVEKRIAGPIGNLIVSGQCHPGDCIEIDVSATGNELEFYAVKVPKVAAQSAA